MPSPPTHAHTHARTHAHNTYTRIPAPSTLPALLPFAGHALRRKPFNARLSVVWRVAGGLLNLAKASCHAQADAWERGVPYADRLPMAVAQQPRGAGLLRQRLPALAALDEAAEAAEDEMA